jgi:DNA repair protein SbcD/Mre11
MKLLHISDWHLGRVTYNEPRTADHDVVLAETIDLARSEQPDLVCHTGDLFDQARPAYPDMVRGISALQELAAIAPVVVLCGNHDSPALFALFHQMLGVDSKIRFIDKARRPDDGGVLYFDTAAGDVLRLAPLPFIHANRMVDAFEEPSRWMANYADRVHLIESALARGLASGFDNGRDVAVFAAHLHVGGAHFSGSERPIHISDTYASRLEHLPTVSYAAFGHIHQPQALPGSVVTGRYAGSPIQLDFGEVGEQKSVVLVEALPGRPAHVQSVNLNGGRPLRRLDGTFDDLRAVAPTVGEELCLVTVHTDTPAVALSEQVRDLFPRAVVLQIHEVCVANRIEVLTKASVAADVEPSFEELFRDYLTEQGTKGAAADRVMRTFESLIAAVDEEQLPAFPEEAFLAGGIEGSTP